MFTEDVFIAERILDEKNTNGTTKFFVKWQGYSKKRATWEPEENILSTELIENFRKTSRKNVKKTS